MKLLHYDRFIILLIIFKTIICPPPTVTVNYQPKKQWKLSKHDLADIKLDIEAEVKIININSFS